MEFSKSPKLKNYNKFSDLRRFENWIESAIDFDLKTVIRRSLVRAQVEEPLTSLIGTSPVATK